MKTASGIAQEKDVVVRGLRFKLIETESRWPGQGDIFVLRLREDGKYHEEFCGFRSFHEAEEDLRYAPEVAVWAGFKDAKAFPPPKDREIEALGCAAWHQPAGEDDEGPFSECFGTDPFTGRVRWLVLDGWQGWAWAGSGLVVSSGIDDQIGVHWWKEASGDLAPEDLAR
jgi:hypothetical protein